MRKIFHFGRCLPFDRIVEAQADDDHTLIGKLFAEFDGFGRLDAGNTPRCPAVDDNHFAFVGGDDFVITGFVDYADGNSFVGLSLHR